MLRPFPWCVGIVLFILEGVDLNISSNVVLWTSREHWIYGIPRSKWAGSDKGREERALHLKNTLLRLPMCIGDQREST